MAYEKFSLGTFCGEKAYKILLNLGYSMGEAQRLIDKGRLSVGEKILAKNDMAVGEVFLVDYSLNPKGLKPVFECEKFAVFDKPSGVLSHPNGRHCTYSLNDEIWSLFSRKAAVAHRLDRETSGLIVVGKDKAAVVELKRLFESRAVYKSYLALVRGDVRELAERVGEFDGAVEVLSDFSSGKNFTFLNVADLKCQNEKYYSLDFDRYKNLDTQNFRLENSDDFCSADRANFSKTYNAFCPADISSGSKNLNASCVTNVKSSGKNFSFRVDAAMDLAQDYDDVKMRMQICKSGKKAVTEFELVEYFDDMDVSLLRCYPLTGRQHQIRLHLFHVQHPILGEPLYGLTRKQIIKILDGKMGKNERVSLTGASRLLLHADEIAFEFDGEKFHIKSGFVAQDNFCQAFANYKATNE